MTITDIELAESDKGRKASDVVFPGQNKQDKLTAVMFMQRDGHLSAPNEAIFAIQTLFLIHMVLIALENPLGFFPTPNDTPWFWIQVGIRAEIILILGAGLTYCRLFLKLPLKVQDQVRKQYTLTFVLTLVWTCHQASLFFMFVLRPNAPYFVRFSCFLHALTTMIMCSLGGIMMKNSLSIWTGNMVLWFFYNSYFKLMDYSNLFTLEYFPILLAAGLVGFLHQHLKVKSVRISRQNRQLAIEERKRAETLVDAILPPQVAHQFRGGKKSFAGIVDDATILFIGVIADEDSDDNTENDDESAFLEMINVLYGAFDDLADELGLLAIERLRDTYVVVGASNGVDRWQNHDNPATIIAIMAARVLEIVIGINKLHIYNWNVKLGINSGPVISIVVGRRDCHFTLLGDNVNVAARMMQSGKPGQIHASLSTYKRLNGRHLPNSTSLDESDDPDMPQLKRESNLRSDLFHDDVQKGKMLSPITISVALGQRSECRIMLHPRGPMDIKGKGLMETFWLEVKENVTKIRRTLQGTTVGAENVGETDIFAVSQLIAESVRLNKLSLAFDEHPDQETEFQEDYGVRNRMMLRNLVAIAFIPVTVAAVILMLQGAKVTSGAVWYYVVGTGYITIWGVWTILLSVKAMSRFASQITCFTFMILDVCLTTLETWLYMTHGRTNIMQNITDACMIIWAVFVFMRLSFPFNLFMPGIFLISDTIMFSIVSPYGFTGAMMRVLIAGGMSFCGIEVERYLEAAARYDYLLRAEVQKQRARANGLVKTLLPPYAATRMVNREDTDFVDKLESCTVLQTDIVGFTTMSSKVEAKAVAAVVNRLFSVFDDLVSKHNLCRMYTVGDAYIVVGGVPGTTHHHSRAACELGLDMINCLDDVNKGNLAIGLPDNVNIRVGIATGRACGGIVLGKRPTYVLWGDAVVQAEVMEKGAKHGDVCVARSTIQNFESVEKAILENPKRGSKVARYLRDLITRGSSKQEDYTSPKGSPFRFISRNQSSPYLTTDSLKDTLLNEAFHMVPADMCPSSPTLSVPSSSDPPSPQGSPKSPWLRDQSNFIKPLELAVVPRPGPRRRHTLTAEVGRLANFILSRS